MKCGGKAGCGATGVTEDHFRTVSGSRGDRLLCRKTNQFAKMVDEDTSKEGERTSATAKGLDGLRPKSRSREEEIESINEVLQARDLLKGIEERLTTLDSSVDERLTTLKDDLNEKDRSQAAATLTGLRNIADRLEAVFEAKRTPDDAVTRREIEKDLDRLEDRLEPALNVAANLKEAVGTVRCDNCSDPIQLDDDQCPHCGGNVFWEVM